MSREKKIFLAFCSLLLVFAIYQILPKRTLPKPGFVRPVDTVIVNNKGELDFQRKAEWIEKMHSAAPGVDWRFEDQRTRLAKYDRRMSKTPIRIQNPDNAWREIGSNNLSGRMHCADYDAPSGFLYCASSGGNVWRSDLNGSGWTCLNELLQMRDIKALRVVNLGATHRVIVCATKGVFYTDDEGAQWSSAGGFSGPQSWGGLRELAIANDTQRTMYVLAEEWDYTNWYAMTTVYRSVDKAANFSRIASFGRPTYGDSWKFDIWTDVYGNGDVFLVENANVSVISGTEITKIASYPLTVPGTIYLTGRQSGGNTYLYVLVAHDGRSDIYGSDGTVGNWTHRGSIPETPFMMNAFECSMNFYRLFMGGVNCYWSSDGGVNWTKTSDWTEYYANPSSRLHADICGINTIRDALRPEIVLLSTDGGMYWSTDGVVTVNNISLLNLNVSQYYSIYTNRSDSGKIYAGSQDQGYQVGSGALNPTPGNFTQVISGDYGNLTSSDGGQSIWCVYCGFAMYVRDYQILASADFPCFNQFWLPPLMADPEDPQKAYLGGGRTSSGGAHLYRLNYSFGQITYEELPFDFCPGTQEKISAMACSPLNSAYRYVMTSDRRFYFSTDSGGTWTQTSGFNGPPPQFLFGSCILPSPVQLGRVYISGSGYSNPPVYVSNDNGQTFSDCSTGLPNTLVTSIAAVENESVLFAATEVGPYAYLNGSWVDISQDVAPNQAYNCVDAVPGSGVIRFATYGRGIWEVNWARLPNPIPHLTSLSPAKATSGGTGFTLTLLGSDFVPNSVVRWNGNDKLTTFVSESELRASISSTDIAAGGEFLVTVVTPAPGGGSSEAIICLVENPLPQLLSLSPAKASSGGAGFALSVSGSGFVPNSTVRWNGTNKVTTYVSGSELQAAIPAGDIATGGEFQVTVVNPAPGGGISSAVVFPVSTLTMTSSPASATINAGQSAAYSIQLTPQFGSFDSSVSFSCTGLPRGCTASFSPASIIPGAAVATTTLTVTTKSSQSTALGATAGPTGSVPPAAGLLYFFIALLLWSCFRRSVSGRPFRRRLAAGALACLIGVLAGCGAGGDGNNPPANGTPSGTYQIMVQGNSGSLAVSNTVTLIVN
jgi:hypothetical protein